MPIPVSNNLSDSEKRQRKSPHFPHDYDAWSDVTNSQHDEFLVEELLSVVFDLPS